MTPGPILTTISTLIAAGGLFVCNDSGGKDSQAMKVLLKQLVPHDQLLIMHAHLPEVEWEGSLAHIERYADGIPVVVAQAAKTFIEMVDHRKMFPSPKNRQCTSDLKRNPIEREIRRYLKSHPEFGGLIVNCMGLRAAESVGRSKLVPFKRNEGNSKAGRSWYDWLPIHDYSTEQVFDAIKAAGEEPFWTYGAGMKRKSCCFCIFATAEDHTLAARLVPDTYALVCGREKLHGFSLSMTGKMLPEITGIEP